MLEYVSFVFTSRACTPLLICYNKVLMLLIRLVIGKQSGISAQGTTSTVDGPRVDRLYLSDHDRAI